MNLNMQRFKKVMVITLLSMVGIQPALATYNLEEHIADYALTSADTAEPMIQSNRVADIISPALKQGIKDKTVLTLFGQTTKRAPLKRAFLTLDSWKSLEIFSGANLFGKIDRTVTTFGKWTLADWLVDFAPVTDINQLQRRQHIIKALVENEDTFNLLEKSLQAIKEIESSLLIFFLAKHSIRQQALSTYYVNREVQEVLSLVPVGGEKFGRETMDMFDRSPNLLLVTNFIDRWSWSVELFMLIYFLRENILRLKEAPGNIGTSFKSVFNFSGADLSKFSLATKAQGLVDKYLPASFSKPGSVAISAACLLCVVMLAHGTLNKFVNDVIAFPQEPFKLKNRFKTSYQVQTTVQNDFIKLKGALDLLRNTKAAIETQTDLKELLTESKAFFEFFDPITKKKASTSEKRIRELKGLLNTSTFKGKPSYFSHIGRIFAANSLMRESKEQWAELFRAIGSLDAYLSLAKLIKENKGNRVEYCFPEYVTHATPVLEMKSFWNPAIGSDRVIPNDVEMGLTKRNIILTGPNSGGKSTIGKAVVANILLSRLGIAAASSMRLTPFTNVNVYMNVTDKLDENLSHFVAGAVLAKHLLDRVRALPSTEFSFSLIDEIFKGTNAEDEAKIAKKYAKELAKENHNITMQITHLDSMKHMDDQEMATPTCKLFDHFKVDIEKDAQGKLHRNYKLKPGISDQRVAEEILEEYGLGFN